MRFEFAGVPFSKRRYWLVFDRGEADLCMRDPGFDVDLYVSAPVRTLAEVWLGHDTIRNATRNDRLRFEGARKDIRPLQGLVRPEHLRAGRQTAAWQGGVVSRRGTAS